MTEEEKWNALILSIKKAAKILGIDLTEEDIPEYLNWFSGAKMHKNLWNSVYLLNVKEE